METKRRRGAEDYGGGRGACPVCGKGFRTYRSLKQHLQNATDVEHRHTLRGEAFHQYRGVMQSPDVQRADLQRDHSFVEGHHPNTCDCCKANFGYDGVCRPNGRRWKAMRVVLHTADQKPYKEWRCDYSTPMTCEGSPHSSSFTSIYRLSGLEDEWGLTFEDAVLSGVLFGHTYEEDGLEPSSLDQVKPLWQGGPTVDEMRADCNLPALDDEDVALNNRSWIPDACSGGFVEVTFEPAEDDYTEIHNPDGMGGIYVERNPRLEDGVLIPL